MRIEDLEKKGDLGDAHGILAGVRKLIQKLLPGKHRADEELTLERLRDTIVSMGPAIEDIAELRAGILREFNRIMV